MKKTYTCKYCKKPFGTNQARNGHQNWCQNNPTTTDRRLKQSLKMKGKAYGTKSIKKEYTITCKKCGKQYSLQLTEYVYKSQKYKKYCSRQCANSRAWTQQDKLIKSNSAKNSQKCKIASKNQVKFEKFKTCPVCEKQFLTRSSIKIFCNKDCQIKGQKNGMFKYTKPMGGYRKGSGYGKSGWYKGIYCDSSWQLAYVMYHLDKCLPIKRNKQKRFYNYNGKSCVYIPDFITNDGIIQIKGYITQQWLQKIKQNQDIKVLYKEQIQFYLDYAINLYGKDYIKYYQK